MSVLHIVQFQFKSSVSEATIQDTCNRMLSLKDSCIHPDTKAPYIVSSKGGRECSIEGMQDGITHVFVVEFESTAHRDYYAKEDAGHLAFGASLGPLLDKAQVVDFEPGKFTKQ
ncbi:hypothetical protein N7478_001349 [Penicillium angulare]|uniref:uncharacterized protein n=1 Tax=Penicillium angulare TaxID=116970 RepID=UPI0025420E21|nr:uncharacterized protein N7478_001349 [Penicillium angulare]KAJ5292098.1 hypothetical protein N7478_001349 [Penicillium angulare]